VNDNKIKFWEWVLVGLISVAICVALNWALRPANAQFDLTEDKRYTIPPALARIAQAKIADKEALKVTVYLSESLPRYVEHLPRTIRTRLDEVRRACNGRLEYEFIDPKDDVDLMQELSDKFKIQPVQLQDVREGEVTHGTYYMSMVFRYKQQFEHVNLRELGMELVKEERLLAVLPGLIATRLMKVTTPPEEVVVGIASEKKTPPPQQGQQPKATDGLDPLRERLKAHVSVKDVAVKGGAPIPPDIKTLLLYKPEALTPLEVFQLDQFMMRGGKLIVLLDNFSSFDYDRMQQIQQGFQQEVFTLRPVDTGLKDWLAFYGIDLLPGIVLDRFNHKLVRVQQIPGRPPVQEVADMPGLVNVRELDADKKSTGQLDAGEMTLAGIGALAFLLPAPLQLEQAVFAEHNPGAKLDWLAKSSSESWVAKDVGDTIPMFNAKPPPKEEWRSSVLVARASGPLRSYWADKDVPRREPVSPADSQPTDASKLTVAPADRPAQLWVVSDADFAHEVWQGAFGRNPLDRFGIAAAQGMGVSASMVLNMVDVAALGSELVEIRRARLIDRSIDAGRVKEDRNKILFLNIALMPLVFVVFGLLWWMFRSLQTFVPSPRQPVTVPSAPPGPDPLLHEAAVAEKTDSHP
jgi:hypothetical protein